jgi:serine/threonine protein kinase
LIGSIVGVLLIGTGVFLVVILIRKRRKRKGTQIYNSNTTTSLIEITTKHSSQSGPTNQTQLLETSRTCTKYSQISLSEIAIVKELGEGSYGKVCLGKWRAARVALKFCKNKENLDEFINEMKLMIELPPHPNVVQVFGVSLDGPQPVIVMEYCAGGSLDTLLFDSNTKLSDEQKLRLVRGIAAGMLHLHEHNIVHRDLAARNILLTGSGDPKISDFGMSRILQK